MHSDLGPTTLRGSGGYRDLNTAGDSSFQYLGPVIIAQKNKPVRVKLFNRVGTGTTGDLFIPSDHTIMGAGVGIGGSYSDNRATLHLHGGFNPWISDGTPHQWTTPIGESATFTPFLKGESTQDVPDMPPTNPGEMTFYWPNQQSARLQFYHDHAYGITRTNVYAGEVAGYLITDATEQAMITCRHPAGSRRPAHHPGQDVRGRSRRRRPRRRPPAPVRFRLRSRSWRHLPAG